MSKNICHFITRRVDTSTIKGIKQAERLQAKGYRETEGGYKFSSAGLNSLIFWIPNPRIKAIDPELYDRICKGVNP